MKDLDVGKVIKIIWNIVAAIIVILILTKHINIKIDLKELSATDIVSITLAFFSISLSVAFFYMAERQSNSFYIHINKFIQDTATSIGKLEERVKFMGDKQQELSDSFKINIDYNKLSLDLAALQESVSKPNINHQKLKEEVEKIENQININRNSALSEYVQTLSHRLQNDIFSNYGKQLNKDELTEFSIKSINSGQILNKNIAKNFISEMKNNNYLNENNLLNENGEKFIRDVISHST